LRVARYLGIDVHEWVDQLRPTAQFALQLFCVVPSSPFFAGDAYGFCALIDAASFILLVLLVTMLDLRYIYTHATRP
jgi:hypothetical protein